MTKNPVPLKYRFLRKYNGCPKQPEDWRDIKLGDISFVHDPNCPSFEQGFEVESRIGKLKRDNQGSSLTCTWQATSKYGEALDLVENKELPDFSGKGWYPLFKLKDGGAYIRDAIAHAVDLGFPLEADIPSYMEGGKLPDETFMSVKVDSPEIRERAAVYKCKRYVFIDTQFPLTDEDWENIRQVIWQFNGFISGYRRHCLYAVGFLMLNGRRTIHFANSYGEGSDLYYSEGDQNELYDITALVDLPNAPDKINMLRIIADKKTQGDPEAKQYLVGKDGFYRWIYNPTLLKELHDAGVIDSSKLEWIDNFDYSKIKETWAVIK